METGLSFNIFNIFIISASIHGLIFGFIVLFSKKFNSKPGKYLAYFILLVSLNNIYFWFIDTNFIEHFKWEYYWFFPIQWSLLMFPAFVFFVWSYLGEKKLPKFYLYFFYISCPILSLFFIQRIISDNFMDNYGLIYKYIRNSFSLISILFSSIAIFHSFKMINDYKKKKKKLKIETRWIEGLLLLLILIILLWVSTFYNYNSYYSKITNERTFTYVLWVSLSLLTYRMGYLGIYHLGIFNQRKIIREGLVFETKKTPKQSLKGAKRFTEIDNYINENKLYLDANLTLTSLSETFNLSEGYLSQLINKNTKANFSTYINNLRVKNSKLLLTNNNYKNYTIIAIALESGFNSKSSFYKAFKKITGVSPSEFKNNHENLS